MKAVGRGQWSDGMKPLFCRDSSPRPLVVLSVFFCALEFLMDLFG